MFVVGNISLSFTIAGGLQRS